MLSALSRTGRVAYRMRYSRAYLEDQATDWEAIRRKEAEEVEKKRVAAVHALPANSKNSNNFVKVKMNHGVFNIDPSKEYVKDECWIMQPDPVVKEPAVKVTAIRKYIITSIKKAKSALMCIKKRHILDAINRLENSQRKVCKLLTRTLYNMIDHANQRGINPLRLWVHGYIIGKTKRWKGVRYAARGRGYREKRDHCQVRIILGEKPENQFYEEIGTGKCAPGVVAVVRNALVTDQADYKKLARYTGITTARGRQQQKMIYKRRVEAVMIENEKEGKYEPKKLIAKRIKAELGEQFKQRMNELEGEETSSVALRAKLYKKNMEQ